MSEKTIEKLKRRLLDAQVALTVTGLAPGALSKVQADARELLEVSDEGDVIAKKGSPAELGTLEAHLKRTAPFYFSGAPAGEPVKGGKSIAWSDSQAISENLEEIAAGVVAAQ